MWRGYAENDLDIYIWGIDRRPLIIAQLQELSPVRLAVFYEEPRLDVGAIAPLYVNGVKVPVCPVCPTTYPMTLKEQVYHLERRITALEAKA